MSRLLALDGCHFVQTFFLKYQNKQISICSLVSLSFPSGLCTKSYFVHRMRRVRLRLVWFSKVFTEVEKVMFFLMQIRKDNLTFYFTFAQ